MKKIHIIGGGITGCSLAYFLKDSYEIYVYEKENHLGGLTATLYNLEKIPYQMGAHVLHTNDIQIVQFLKQFLPLENIIYNVAIDPLFDLRYYDFPFTPKSLEAMPWHWKEAILLELESTSGNTANNLKNLIVNFYGESAYLQFFENWIQKWFNKKASSLDMVDWFRRYLRPIEYNGFYSEKYQMFPVNIGWNVLFDKLTQGITVHKKSKVSYKDFNSKDKIIITSRPDEFFDDSTLEYSLLSFDIDSAQYASNKPDTIIYPNHVPFLSITQFGKMFPSYNEKNIVVKDFPKGDIVAHPVPKKKHLKTLEKIKKEYPNIILAGRIGSFQFYDIADCIKQSTIIAAQLKHKGD